MYFETNFNKIYFNFLRIFLTSYIIKETLLLHVHVTLKVNFIQLLKRN